MKLLLASPPPLGNLFITDKLHTLANAFQLLHLWNLHDSPGSGESQINVSGLDYGSVTEIVRTSTFDDPSVFLYRIPIGPADRCTSPGFEGFIARILTTFINAWKKPIWFLPTKLSKWTKITSLFWTSSCEKLSIKMDTMWYVDMNGPICPKSSGLHHHPILQFLWQQICHKWVEKGRAIVQSFLWTKPLKRLFESFYIQIDGLRK